MRSKVKIGNHEIQLAHPTPRLEAGRICERHAMQLGHLLGDRIVWRMDPGVSSDMCRRWRVNSGVDNQR